MKSIINKVGNEIRYYFGNLYLKSRNLNIFNDKMIE